MDSLQTRAGTRATSNSLTAARDVGISRQASAFAQNAQLPPAQMALLAQFTPEQLAAVGQLYASGALQLLTSGASSILPSAAVQPGTAVSTQASDLEDGELDDDEVQTPGHGPEHHVETERPEEPRFTRPSKRRYSSPHTEQVLKRSVSQDTFAQQQQCSEAFLRTMHGSGYGYNALKDQVSQPEQLRRLYELLSIPSETPAATSTAPQTQPTKTAKRAFTMPNQVPLDRQAYLAKLQAAKNKKSEVPAVRLDTSPAKKVKKLDPEKTRLLKEKLAARQAEIAAKQQRPADSTISVSGHSTANTTPRALRETDSGRSSASNRPLDTGASQAHHQRLVIHVSADEDSDDSELDDDSDDQGVPLVTPFSAAENNAYAAKLEELKAARLQMEEMAERARSRTSLAPTPIAQFDGSHTIDEPSGQRPGLQDHLPPTLNTTSVVTRPQDSDVDELDDDDDEAYEDIYKTSTATADPSAIPATPVEPDHTTRAVDEDIVAVDTEVEDTEDFYDAPSLDASPHGEAVQRPSAAPTETQEIDEDRDSDVSMEMSESEGDSSDDDDSSQVELEGENIEGAALEQSAAVDTESAAAPTNLDSVIADSSALEPVRYKHYTPYVSPLVVQTSPPHDAHQSDVICPNETGFTDLTDDNGACTVEDCPYQHFAQMSLRGSMQSP